jgi:acetoin utilization deacetylase AcuC-like enzyme
MTAPGRVLVFSDPAMDGHRPPGHAERPERIAAVESGIADAVAAAGARLERPAVEAADATALERVHPGPYLALLDDAARQGGGWVDAVPYIGPD